MKIMILGGDGFCGWPTALHLSAAGHEVVMLDNYSRRYIDDELDIESLTPVKMLNSRVDAWYQKTGKEIKYLLIDISKEYELLLHAIQRECPDTIIHFAEQRAAPFSMKSPGRRRYTVNNNIMGTHNVLSAIVESKLDTHLVHLGTMGVYGYENHGMELPEGYVGVRMPNGEEKDIVYPYDPGSVYHLTKCQDNIAFQFYAKNDGVRITDLHQGIVWGTQTKETKLDDRLINRFDYDGDYGTVLNRFLVQAVIGHPLTVHGEGGQTRAFIHVQDMVKCIELAVSNPPNSGDRPTIINQATETASVMQVAEMVSKHTGAEIVKVDNPRKESDYNDLDISNQTLLNLGLDPVTMNDGLMDEVIEVVEKYKHRVNRDKIPCVSRW